MIWLGVIYAVVALCFYVWAMDSLWSAFPSGSVLVRIIALGLGAVWPVTLTFVLVMCARD